MMLPLGALIVAADRRAVVRGALSRARLGRTSGRSSSARTSSGTRPARRRQDRSPWFYMPVVFSDSFPLSLVLVAAAVAAWRERDRFDGRCCGAGSPPSSDSSRCRRASRTSISFRPSPPSRPDRRSDRARPAAAASGGRGRTGRLRSRRSCWRSPASACSSCSARPAASTRSNGAVAVGASVWSAEWRPWRRARAAPGGGGVALLAAMIAINWTFVLRVLPSSSATSRPRQSAARSQPRLAPATSSPLPGGAAQPGLLPAPPRRQYFEEPALLDALHTNRRCSPCCRNATTRHSPVDRHADLRHRPPPDVRREAARHSAREPLPELVLITNRCS